MANLIDQIEQYLKRLLESSADGIIELQRSELASLFECVPSQINYVLSARFTVQHGYVVESRRGGGGYIRLMRLPLTSQDLVQQIIVEDLAGFAPLSLGEQIINRLWENKILTTREARVLLRLIQPDTLQGSSEEQDVLRARMLRVSILEILKTMK